MLPTISPTDPCAAEFSQQLAKTGAVLGRARVAAIYCVHGTFVGNDVLGLLTELSRFVPTLSQRLSRVGKTVVDLFTGEAGNYTQAFATTLETALGSGAGQAIPVRMFHWSSQNHHVARADGAIRLIDELAQQAGKLAALKADKDEPPRIQLWAHSHGGNVLALVTQLLGADQKARDTFFRAARSFYQPWICSEVDMPAWQRVRELLDESDHPVRHLALDIVTFGTPIRYRWNSSGYAKLLHFIHHRPPPQGGEYQTPIPLKLLRARRALDGDYIQQIGIAGTNFPPLPFATRTWLADRRLGKLLEQNLVREGIITRLRHGTRVPDAGTTLLVDYDEIHPWLTRHIAGHGLYTWRKWLPFHAREIASRFYSDSFAESELGETR